MKLPAYYTQFLACCEGQHGNCQHIDSEGNVIWVCGCDCHPHVLLNHGDWAEPEYQVSLASA